MYLIWLLSFFSLLCSELAETNDIQVYDYVVVGGGIGGGTLAYELSKSKFRVLLLEAGPDYNSEIIKTPVYHLSAAVDENISFNYPVKYYDSGYLSNKTFMYTRVGNLGGCSRHNAMIGVLPTTKDYQRMVNITGDKSWEEKVMREKYFKKLERNGYLDKVNAKDHGEKGWLPINYIDMKKRFELDEELQEIYNQTRLDSNSFVDINGYDAQGKLNTDKNGRVFVPLTVDNKKYQRYDLPKLVKESKVTIWTDTLATKLILSEDNKRVLGVEYAKGRYLYKASPLSTEENRNKAKFGKVYVNKEVILSAGTFNSPQILMLSGIGPKQQLQELGVQVKVPLEGVGKNLMDKHVSFVSLAYIKDFNIFAKCKFFVNSTDPCFQQYKQTKDSPYISNGVMGGQLLQTNPDSKQPDFFVVTVPGSKRGFTPRYNMEEASRIGPKFNGTLTKLIFKAQPKDQGFLKLRSTSPYDTPLINFNKFQDRSETSDLKNMIRVVKILRKQFKALKLSSFELLPGENIENDEQIENYLRGSMTGFHICCTNKIGKDNDVMAVLDKQFKVRGVENLRVVDASAFPRPPGYFPAIYTHMQSLKVADMIKEEN